ncbi:heterokaryon incompatibility protein-domain-containing protein [Paraphoma chrysanthemicola]|uniref:Heterokaryon incompatibility protein-domain-containing protein n=1 Tax=Paraphoma chrysanthemicola TaxID=798071 RepID=A0A8K0QRP1_9PLEO|nr:heterokaryon incompatibility protein-domain-containing protein [Paraphoma chrysanthemicola]
MEQYQYQQLPTPTSIRLINLDLKPDSDTLACSFEFVDVHCSPEYTALSYVWGDETSKVPITCDGKSISVTSNLHDALEEVCERKGKTRLWADALCINQQDNLEKNKQVAMMATIYSNAAKVLVWLGPDPYSDAPLIFAGIKVLFEVTAAIAGAGGKFKRFDEETCVFHWEVPDGTPVLSPFQDNILFKPDEEGKARIDRFLRLAWFSRTWVLQEVGLASEAVLLWGDTEQNWHYVGITCMFLLHYCKPLLVRRGFAEGFESIRNLYMAFSTFAPGSTFFHLLNNARPFKATNARDKIFGLLSHPTSRTISMATWRPKNWKTYDRYRQLAVRCLSNYHDVLAWIDHLAAEWSNQTSEDEELPPPLIEADYNRSVEDVYRDLAVSHVDRTTSLEILTAVQHIPDSSMPLPTPSWVPRWDQYIGTPILGLYSSSHFASANRKAIVSSSTNPDRLIVRGHIVTRIVATSCLLDGSSFDLPLPPDGIHGPDSPEVHKFWDSNPFAALWLASKLGKLHLAGHQYPQLLHEFAGSGYALVGPHSSIYEAYIKTWVNGQNFGTIDDFNLKADAAAYWERAFYGSEGDPVIRDEDRVPQSVYEARWRRYRDLMANVCNKRKFFFTKKELFGMGPGALKIGDWLAILQGADVPFILREVEMGRDQNKPLPPDLKFELVGECYAHGMMQGQAVRGRELTRDIELV